MVGKRWERLPDGRYRYWIDLRGEGSFIIPELRVEVRDNISLLTAMAGSSIGLSYNGVHAFSQPSINVFVAQNLVPKSTAIWVLFKSKPPDRPRFINHSLAGTKFVQLGTAWAKKVRNLFY